MTRNFTNELCVRIVWTIAGTFVNGSTLLAVTQPAKISSHRFPQVDTGRHRSTQIRPHFIREDRCPSVAKILMTKEGGLETAVTRRSLIRVGS